MTVENGIEKVDKIAESKAETSGTLAAKVEAAARLARPTHFEIASKIMKEKILVTLQETDEVHSYESGVYKPGAQFFIRKKAMELMNNDCVRNFRTEVLDDIRVWTYHPLSEFDKDPLLINLHNGILDPRTSVVTEHKPDYFSLSQLDIVYDPKAQAPSFLAVMEEILPDAYSRQRAIDHFASCLLRRPLKKAFFGIGDTDSGKTLFSQIIAEFLGPRNVSNVAVQELEDKFATYRLVGKLCNMYADVDEKAIKQTSRFKTVTGADTIEVQRKGGQLFEYAPYCKHFYFGNRIPETKDLSDAFFNRWDIVKFLEKFTDDPSEEDPRQHLKKDREGLLSAIALEHSGILNILLARVMEINRLGAIPNSMSADDVRELWFYHSDYISQFLHDWTEKEPLSEVHQSKLYKAYTEFCVRKKTTPRLVKTFDQRIRAFGYMDGDVHERGQDGERGKHIKTWRGMALKASLVSEMSQKSVGSMGSVGAASPQSESKPIQPIHPIENSPIFQNKTNPMEQPSVKLPSENLPDGLLEVKNGHWVKLKDEWMIQCDRCHQFHCDKQEILDGHHKKCPAIYCPRCDTNYGSPNVLIEHNHIVHKEGQH